MLFLLIFLFRMQSQVLPEIVCYEILQKTKKNKFNFTFLNKTDKKKAIFENVNTLYIHKRYSKEQKEMLFTTENISSKEIESINNFFNDFEAVETVTPEEAQKETAVSKYITSLVTNCYQKSVEDIANTQVGKNKAIRKRSLQQVMQESFFYGANRFGRNFIA